MPDFDGFLGDSILETALLRCEVDIPAEFVHDLDELNPVSGEYRHTVVYGHRLAIISRLLNQVSMAKHPLFWAALTHDLGLLHAKSPEPDAEQGSREAIKCYHEALKIFSPETAPSCYAQVQHDLGEAYYRSRARDCLAKVSQAIACYEEALRFRTPDRTPLQYAFTQIAMGWAYGELPSSDPGATIQRAIASYLEAMRFCTVEEDPWRYAMIQAGLGYCYSHLPLGDLKQNASQAIACYQEALRFYDRELMRLPYASVHTFLGVVYADFPGGDRKGNLGKAITHLREALAVCTPERSSHLYSMIQHNLGACYHALPAGDRIENMQRAVSAYREALRFLSPETSPMEWANSQNSLGIVYADSPIGDELANLRSAAACYQAALRVYTLDETPVEYAMVQQNLGVSYLELGVRGRMACLQKAVVCFRDALRVFDRDKLPFDYASIMSLLGEAYHHLSECDDSVTLDQAVESHVEAMRYWSPETAPLEYAMAQYSLGKCYESYPVTPDDRKALKAMACYREALRLHTLEAEPYHHRRTALALGRLLLSRGCWEDAHSAFASALDADENLYLASSTETSRREEVAEAGDLYLCDAYCLAKLGHLSDAAERVESGRARVLAEALARNRTALNEASPQNRQAFETARERIKMLELEARLLVPGASDATTADKFVALSEQMRIARRELWASAERIRRDVPEFLPARLDSRALAGAAEPDRPLVYVLTESTGSLALVVANTDGELANPEAVWIESFREADLDRIVYGQDSKPGFLHGTMTKDGQALRDALCESLPLLGKRLMAPLVERLGASGFDRCALVPCGRLGLLPLHAARLPDGSQLDEVLEISYVPSARALMHARQGEATKSLAFLGIADPPHRQRVLLEDLPISIPTERLPLSRVEVDSIAGLFPEGSSQLILSDQATRSATVARAGAAAYLHFACHGFFEPFSPLDSFLALAGEDRLTLADVLGNLDLSGTRLVVLSACQTALTEFRKAPDEAIGLPAGFLQAGAVAVIGTLWRVNDVSTALLLTRFYRDHLKRGFPPSGALRKAQRWLRQATAAELELADHYAQLYRESGDQDQGALQKTHHYRAHPDEVPFAHAYYWAPFTFTGVNWSPHRTGE